MDNPSLDIPIPLVAPPTQPHQTHNGLPILNSPPNQINQQNLGNKRFCSSCNSFRPKESFSDGYKTCRIHQSSGRKRKGRGQGGEIITGQGIIDGGLSTLSGLNGSGSGSSTSNASNSTAQTLAGSITSSTSQNDLDPFINPSLVSPPMTTSPPSASGIGNSKPNLARSRPSRLNTSSSIMPPPNISNLPITPLATFKTLIRSSMSFPSSTTSPNSLKIGYENTEKILEIFFQMDELKTELEERKRGVGLKRGSRRGSRVGEKENRNGENLEASGEEGEYKELECALQDMVQEECGLFFVSPHNPSTYVGSSILKFTTSTTTGSSAYSYIGSGTGVTSNTVPPSSSAQLPQHQLPSMNQLPEAEDEDLAEGETKGQSQDPSDDEDSSKKKRRRLNNPGHAMTRYPCMGSMTFNVLNGKKVGYVKICHRCQHLGYGNEPEEPEEQEKGRKRRKKGKTKEEKKEDDLGAGVVIGVEAITGQDNQEDNTDVWLEGIYNAPPSPTASLSALFNINPSTPQNKITSNSNPPAPDLANLDPYLISSPTPPVPSTSVPTPTSTPTTLTYSQSLSILKSYQTFLEQQNSRGLFPFLAERVSRDLDGLRKTLGIVEEQKETESERQDRAIRRAQRGD